MKRKIKSCYNCNSQKNKFYAKENGIVLVQCINCKLIFQQEILNNKDLIEAHRQGMHIGEEVVEAVGKFQKGKIKFYKKVIWDIYKNDFKGCSNLLDVGCGFG